MAEKPYKKLSGRSVFSVQQAYLGKDHLLVADGTYQERVKRIGYADIEAILICPTKAGSIWSLIAALGGLLFTIISLANFGGVAFFIWLTIALVLWGIFGVGLYGRGSVVFGVQTAVQTVVLAGLSNQRKARWAKKMLAEHIEAVQGPLEVEVLRAARSLQLRTERHAGGRPLAAAGASVRTGPPTLGNRGDDARLAPVKEAAE